MALPIRKVSAQLQLSDAVKRDYPGSAVVSLLIQQLANMPTLTGGGGKVLAVNSEETAIELITRPAGSGTTTFTTVTDFPGSPTNNQIILLTQKQGANEVGFYQYRISRWVALFIQSASLDLPVGQTLPSVAEAGSLFFLTQAHLTNSSGVYFRTGSPLAWVQIADNSDITALTASLTALTARVGSLEGDNPVTGITLSGSTLRVTRKDNSTSDINLPSGGASSILGLDDTPDTFGSVGQVLAVSGGRDELLFSTLSWTSLNDTPNALVANRAVHTNSTGDALVLVEPSTGGGVAEQSIIYGNTAVKSAIDSDANAVTNARAEALTAFAISSARTTKAVSLQTGGLIPITFPNPTGYYRPFIAIATSDVTNIRIYNGETLRNETSKFWTTATSNLASVAYTIYVRTVELRQGRSEEWIVKNYA